MSSWPPAVLVAAEQGIMRRALRDMLRRCGIQELEILSSSTEAFQEVNEGTGRWQVLFLESALPGVMESVRRIRERLGPSIRVILISSKPTEAEILEAIQAGADDFFAFPFSEATVEKKLQKPSDTKAMTPACLSNPHSTKAGVPFYDGG